MVFKINWESTIQTLDCKFLLELGAILELSYCTDTLYLHDNPRPCNCVHAAVLPCGWVWWRRGALGISDGGGAAGRMLPGSQPHSHAYNSLHPSWNQNHVKVRLYTTNSGCEWLHSMKSKANRWRRVRVRKVQVWKIPLLIPEISVCLSVCWSHISRTLHLISFTLGMCIVKGPRTCRADFGAVWTHNFSMNRQTALCSSSPSGSVYSLFAAAQLLQVTLTVSERKLQPASPQAK